MNEIGVVDVGMVSRTLEQLFVQSGRPIVFEDEERKELVPVAPKSAAAPDGLLPLFLVAAEAVWRECMGTGFGLVVVRDADGLLGYRVKGINAGMFAGVMLTMMEAIAQSVRSGRIVVNELDFIWRAAIARASWIESDATEQGVSP